MAPKKKSINYEFLKALCRIHATDAEIAVALGISIDTITRRKQTSKKFQQIYYDSQEEGKVSLRRKQWEAAMEGKGWALIWLGKQHLGQVERSEFTGAGGAPLVPQPQTRTVDNGNLGVVIQSLVDCGAIQVHAN
jgi:hypothetical protein